MAGWQVGIDIGGTFTDVVACNIATRQVVSTKIRSTREQPRSGIARWTFTVALSQTLVDELSHDTMRCS